MTHPSVLGDRATASANSARSQTHHITRPLQQCLGLGAKQLTEGATAEMHETFVTDFCSVSASRRDEARLDLTAVAWPAVASRVKVHQFFTSCDSLCLIAHFTLNMASAIAALSSRLCRCFQRHDIIPGRLSLLLAFHGLRAFQHESEIESSRVTPLTSQGMRANSSSYDWVSATHQKFLLAKYGVKVPL